MNAKLYAVAILGVLVMAHPHLKIAAFHELGDQDDDEGHGLAKRVNRLDAYPRMFDFLCRHLRV